MIDTDPEALIRDARRRTRRRRTRVAAAGAALIVGVVLASVARVPAGRWIVAETSSRPFANLRAFGANDGILAFVSRSQLWVLDGRAGSLRMLTWPWQLAADPVFSPDGRWLTYTLDYNDEVFVARANGSDPRRVPDSAGGPASWLPTDELLTGGAVVWRIASDGVITRVASSPDLMAWSPDGRRYAFVSERWSGPLPPHPARGIEQLSVATSLDGPRTAWLTVPLSFSPSSGMNGELIDNMLVLTRGHGIVFKTDPGLSDIADGSGIYEIRAAGAKPRQIGFALGLPVADAAGDELAITNAPSHNVLNRVQWLTKSVRVCSSNPERCTTLPTAPGVLTLDPAWSPNGRMLAFVEAPSSSQVEATQQAVQHWYATHSLWLIRRPGATPTPVAGTSGASAPEWSANRRSILYAAGDSLWLLPTVSSRPIRIAAPLFQPGAWPAFYGQVDWAGQFAWLTRP